MKKAYYIFFFCRSFKSTLKRIFRGSAGSLPSAAATSCCWRSLGPSSLWPPPAPTCGTTPAGMLVTLRREEFLRPEFFNIFHVGCGNLNKPSNSLHCFFLSRLDCYHLWTFSIGLMVGSSFLLCFIEASSSSAQAAP